MREMRIYQTQNFQWLKLIDEPLEDPEYPRLFPYTVVGLEPGEYPKASIWDKIKQAPKYLYVMVFDIDFKSDYKHLKKLADEDPDFFRRLDHFRKYIATKIQREYQEKIGENFQVSIIPSKHLFHIGVHLYVPVILTEETRPVVWETYKSLKQLLQPILPYYLEIDDWDVHKSTYHRVWIELEDFNIDTIQPILQMLDTYEEEAPDTENFHKIISEMVKVFQNREKHEGVEAFGGDHHSFILLLAGELARSGYSLEDAFKIYENYFQPWDNPRDIKQRIAIIRHTYKRFENGEGVASWRQFKPRWRLGRKIKIDKPIIEIEDILHRGYKVFYYPDSRGGMVGYYVEKRKNRKPILRRKTIHFPFSVIPIKIEDNKISFQLRSSNAVYTVLDAIIPNTPENRKIFLQQVSHIPLPKKQIEMLLNIIDNYIAFKDILAYTIQTEITDRQNELTSTHKPTTFGLRLLYQLWTRPEYKAYRVGLALACMNYWSREPKPINPIVWLYGTTGTGKSLTIKFIANALNARVNTTATYNALETLASQNEPIFIDDLAVYIDTKSQIVFDLIFTIWEGTGKARRTSHASTQTVFQHRIKTSLFLASEIDPSKYIAMYNGYYGILRRVLLCKFTERIPYPEDAIWEEGGFAKLMKPIQVLPEHRNAIKDLKYEDGELLAGVIAFYEKLNAWFGTNYDPLQEFLPLIQHHKDVAINNARYKLIYFVRKQLARKYPEVVRIYNDRIYIPFYSLDELAAKFNLEKSQLRQILNELSGGAIGDIPISVGELYVPAWDITNAVLDFSDWKEE